MPLLSVVVDERLDADLDESDTSQESATEAACAVMTAGHPAQPSRTQLPMELSVIERTATEVGSWSCP